MVFLVGDRWGSLSFSLLSLTRREDDIGFWLGRAKYGEGSLLSTILVIPGIISSESTLDSNPRSIIMFAVLISALRGVCLCPCQI